MSGLNILLHSLTDDVKEQLDKGLAKLGLVTTAEQLNQLLGLLALLHKWNRAYNLTAVRDIRDMVSRHLLDSASVSPFVSGPRLLDVGSGPGFPGLVLAILNPDLAVTLVDSNGKKVRFQRQAVMELGINNVTPVQTRVETFAAGTFDQVISRAFASLGDFIGLTRALPTSEGQWLAMKGPGVEHELDTLPDDIALQAHHLLQVPYDAAQRQLLILTRKELCK
ncbi:MAG: 16S rRNA (guanine(527)-N(7))-methyltransferase RsmG [Halomonas sp.]|nr:16S rRNA (guanine(527)-N(7))-methyltransferase RsmG [Halomonas sp.]TVM06352.1 MAG: 16S rRNA (guanine(527)-N(7))-methyltransferase RsmG [Halomonas sp.]